MAQNVKMSKCWQKNREKLRKIFIWCQALFELKINKKNMALLKKEKTNSFFGVSLGGLCCHKTQKKLFIRKKKVKMRISPECENF